MSKKSLGNPGRPAASLDRDARDLLLAAATELFAEHGVAATTFAMIAKRAGLTPAMLHYYFTNREQLLDVVVEERLAPLIASVWTPVEVGADPKELILGVVERMLAGIEQMPWVPSTWMREVLNEGGLLRTRMLRHLPFEKVKILGEAVARGQASKTVNPNLDSGLIGFSVIGLVMLHMATLSFSAQVFARKAPAADSMSRHITGLLLDGLRPPSPARSRKTRGNKNK
ncbi:AcrR family transcriptional regulator [Silvibacterium bohemicum]|uniref:AcrR family transcriptional regulator n=1 Tax=Silvibacterium bohemicum TaxID=1577686 RepID=A0A841K0H3_9BACT|nr:TetR/AcrR family transcriptional regulator [Silvibacterium bohemicum]MBB6143744.1 AcrR family transcriptional regulator [Silvibacterium bohemicum]